jgi:hypothetical protein
MKKIAATVGSLFALWAGLSIFPTVAQNPQFPQTLPPNTVVGRTGISAGPAQAIPFAALTPLLTGTPNTWNVLQTFNAGTSITNSTSPFSATTYDGVTTSGKAGSQITSTDNSAQTGLERYTNWISADTQGTGDSTPQATTFALGLSAIKNNWQTTTVAGEFGGLNIAARCGHANAIASGDCSGLTTNVAVSQTNNFVTNMENVSGYFPLGSTTGSLFINTQIGSIKASGLDVGSNTGVGFFAAAQNGLLGHAFSASNLCASPKFGTCSKWLDFLNYNYDDGTHTPYNAFNVNQSGQLTLAGFGAVNTNQKTIRVGTSVTNNLEVVNAAGNALPLSLTDGGSLNVLSNYQVNGVTVADGAAWTAFTPAFACGTATIANNSSRSKTLGKTTFIEIDFTITAVGAGCASNVTFTLPNTANSSGLAGAGQEIVNTALFGGCRVAAASSTATCALNGGSSWVTAPGDHFVGSGVYENQ